MRFACTVPQRSALESFSETENSPWKRGREEKITLKLSFICYFFSPVRFFFIFKCKRTICVCSFFTSPRFLWPNEKSPHCFQLKSRQSSRIGKMHTFISICLLFFAEWNKDEQKKNQRDFRCMHESKCGNRTSASRFLIPV